MGSYNTYKTQLIECTLALSEGGFFGGKKGTGGNLSMRVEGEEKFVITPSSFPYNQLTPEKMCVMDFDGNQLEGDLKPSVESGMHLIAYKNRPDVNAVIHTHQIYASMFAVLNMPIPPLFDEVTLHIGHIVDVIPYGLSGSEELAANTAKLLENTCHCYLIQNHGALTLGPTLDQAWMNVEFLEKTAKVYQGALATGNKVNQIPDDIIELMKALRKG